MGEDIYVKTSREKSALIRYVQRVSKVSSKELAKTISVSVPTFNSKLHRDSFTWEEMNLIFERCGYRLTFKKT